MRTLQDFGWVLNFKKTTLNIARRLEYLGIILDLRGQSFSSIEQVLKTPVGYSVVTVPQAVFPAVLGLMVSTFKVVFICSIPSERSAERNPLQVSQIFPVFGLIFGWPWEAGLFWFGGSILPRFYPGIFFLPLL